MSALQRCPRADELVTLLGAPDAPVVPVGDVGLRRHTGECPQCRDELLRLSEGFAAMGVAPEPYDGEARAQERIAARVMAELFSRRDATVLPAAIERAAAPVPPAAATTRLLGLGALVALLVVPAVLGWLQGGYALRAPVRGLGLALLPIGLLPMLLSSAPRRQAALGAALGVAIGLILSAVAGMEVGFLAGAGCLLLAATGCLVPAALVLRAAPAAAGDTVNQALRGVAIFSGSAALQRALCGVGGWSHALVFHLLPFFMAVALFTLLYRRLAVRASAAA